MAEAVKGAGLLVLIVLAELISRIAGVINRHAELVSRAALCGIAVLLTWMSFDAADYSRLDSLILFGSACVLFIIGLKTLPDSRLFNANRDT